MSEKTTEKVSSPKEIMDKFTSDMKKYFMSLYDEGEPNMSESEWKDQVDVAEDVLSNELKKLVESVDNDLINGEYYQE